MIWARRHTGCSWFPLDTTEYRLYDFNFKDYMFQIGDTIYIEHSEEFEKAVFWEILKHDRN